MSLQANLVVYDVPSTLDINNPSKRMHRVGFRVNLSCWVVPEHRTPWLYLEQLKQAGVRWHVLKFDAAEAEKIADLAVSAIKDQLDDVLVRAKKSLDRAEEQLDEELDYDAYDRRVSNATKRVDEALEAAKEAAAGFGIRELDAPLLTAEDAVSVLKKRANEKAAAFKALVESVAGTPLEPVAEDVPPAVLANYAEEQGEGEVADRARRAFAEVS